MLQSLLVTTTDADRMHIILDLVLDDSNQMRNEVIAKADVLATTNFIR